MSYQVLARKYRPLTFNEVVGHNYITDSLKKSVITKKIGHAYLLCGTRGIGKTTVARILAKAVCCNNPTLDGNPCLSCDSCNGIQSQNSMDVLELDGASNNGVEQIRQLIETVNFLPATGEKRVYIIDEVHMLTKEAFNALLKTLEEPPAHVVFIFATTSPEKILPTVISRCQRFDFRNATVEMIYKNLSSVCSKENINFERDELLWQIAKEAKGSFRDSLSLLDQVLTFSEGKTISSQEVGASLGLASIDSASLLIKFLIVGDVNNVQKYYREFLLENVSPQKIGLTLLDLMFVAIENIDNLNYLSKQFKLDTQNLSNISYAEIFWIYETLGKDLNWCLESLDPSRVLEIVLKKIALRHEFFRNTKLKNDEKLSSKNIEISESEEVESAKDITVLQRDVNVNKADEEAHKKIPKEVVDETEEELISWEGFLAFVFKKSPVIAANLEQGNIVNTFEVNSGKSAVELGFSESNDVFYDYLQDQTVKDKIAKFLAEYLNISESSVTISFQIFNNEEQKDANFKSQAQIYIEREEKQLKDDESSLKENAMIQFAQDIFKKEVDKVILDRK